MYFTYYMKFSVQIIQIISRLKESSGEGEEVSWYTVSVGLAESVTVK